MANPIRGGFQTQPLGWQDGDLGASMASTMVAESLARFPDESRTMRGVPVALKPPYPTAA